MTPMGDGSSGRPDGRLLDELTTIVSAAAPPSSPPAPVRSRSRAKADHSPVTAADHAAEAVILDGACPRACRACWSCRRRPRADRRRPAWRRASCWSIRSTGPRELRRRPGRVHRQCRAGERRPTACSASSPHRRCGLIWRGIEGRGAERLRLGRSTGERGARARAIRTRRVPHCGPSRRSAARISIG